MRRHIQVLLGLIPWAYARDYCTRIFHSAVVNNQTLYVAGGESRWVTGATNITESRLPGVQAVDLSKSWSNTDTDLYKSIDTQNPPSLDAGGAFSDGTNLYYYGGYVTGPREVPPIATYEYDIQNKIWDSDDIGGHIFTRVSAGSTAQSTVNNKAYYLGGVVVPGADPSIAGTTGALIYIVQGLLSLDQNTKQWTNLSSNDMNDYGTIVDGYLNLIESVGDEGILVSYGGFKRPPGQDVSLLTSDNLEPSAHVRSFSLSTLISQYGADILMQNSMEYVSVYDIANHTWYTQQTTGDIPNWRMGGCSVVAPAQDESSYSIYTWGGWGINATHSDGDVYVLSVPSFKWIRVNKGYKFRHKHKCQLANKHTMLSVGGTVPQDGAEYQPAPVNCDKSGQWANGMGIFDLRSHQWNTNYDAEDQGEYTLTSTITNVIGGSETGGATVTKPDNGFNGTGLEALFTRRSTKPSSSAESSNLSGGAIAGITVGVVAAVAIAIAVLVFFLIVRKRRRNQAAIRDQKDRIPVDPRSDTYTNPAELEGRQTANEMGTGANMVEKPPDGVIAEVPAKEPPAAELSAETPPVEMDGTGVRN